MAIQYVCDHCERKQTVTHDTHDIPQGWYRLESGTWSYLFCSFTCARWWLDEYSNGG